MEKHHSKNAIITGAASGIGRAIAIKLFNENYSLALIDRNEEQLKKLKNELEQPGNNISIFIIDITDTNELVKCIEEIKVKFINIDVLVNNAGLLYPGLLETPFDKFNEMLKTHLIAAYHFICKVAPLMKKNKRGYIFNISSQSGKRARPEYGTYAISKYALNGLNEALYEEMMPYNVKVTTICPSVTDTNLIKCDKKIKNEDKIQAEDIASTIWYLLNLGNNAFIKEVCIDCQSAFLEKLKR